MNRGRSYAVAVGAMIVGSALVFGALLLINELATAENDRALTRVTTIEIQRLEKPEPKKVVRPTPPRPPRTPKVPPPPSLAALDSSLSGIDVGLPAFEVGDLGELNDQLLGDVGDVVMTSDTVDQAPRAIRRAAMAYPYEARAKAVEGYVELSILVDEDGAIEQVRAELSDIIGLRRDLP